MDELQERRGPGRPPNPRPPEPPVPIREPAEPVPVRARRVRNPFGAQVQQLAYPQRPNYHRHWFNDADAKPWIGRLQVALDGGYEHVKDNEGKNVMRVVGSTQTGHPINCYLMEIPEEWFQEDMAAQQKEIDAKEESIKRAQFERTKGDGQYVPPQGISIKHGR